MGLFFNDLRILNYLNILLSQMHTPNVLIPYSIVIPTRNEEETIEEVLQGVRDMTDDLIIVDGHSYKTKSIIASFFICQI